MTDIVFSIAEVIGIDEIHDGYGEPTPVAKEDRRLGNPLAGCQVCGQPYAGVWIVARTWRCGAHRP